MEPHKRFARNVRELRADRGLSQEALGNRCDLHPTEISRLERAVREPRLSTIVRVARALDVRPSELLDGINERAGVDAAVIERAEAGASPGLFFQGRISAALGEPPSQVFPRRWAGADLQAARPGHQVTPDQ